jgi:dihydroxynaphthoic acid synthetase
MSGYEDILFAKTEGVARITINRPKTHNAFRTHTLEELVDAFQNAGNDPGIGVIVLSGAGGRAFSTGGDVKWERDLSVEHGKYVHDVSMRLSHAMRDNGKPVIAAVNGYCIGGGNELNLLCDLTIATEKSIFGQAGPRIGSVPIWFGTQLLTLNLGEKRAREIVYLCRQYTARQALEMGWINAVVPEPEFDATVNQWCQEILEKSPQALRLAKFSINCEADRLISSVNQGFHALTLFYGTEEFREGCSAFVEKRKPDFRRFRAGKTLGEKER